MNANEQCRADTVARVPPRSHAANSHRNHIIMYVSIPSSLSRSLRTNNPQALLLAGCSSSSPLIPGIFLISIFYEPYDQIFSPAQVDPGVSAAIRNIVGNAQLEVRVGYFGICVTQDGAGYLCSNNATALAQNVNIDQDPFNLIWIASTFKDAVVFPYLL
jgi:hypothetical protein